MAKQSGIHQLRGKVGEHSYYRQTGVETGLVRSINQGMSNRVKTGAEYANTRLNNAEFGHACAIAGVLGHTVTPKYRPMVLPFSQSKMARIILEAIKETTGNWGERTIPTGDTGKSVLSSALNSIAKVNYDDFGLVITSAADSFEVEAGDQTVALLSAIGADGITVNVIRNNVQVGKYVDTMGRYQYSYRVWNTKSDDLDAESGDSITFLNFSAPQLPPVPAGQAEDFALDVVVLMPFRTINGENHILQEYCTFKAY